MHRGTTCDPPEINWVIGTHVKLEGGGQGERVGVVSFKYFDIKKLEEVLLRKAPQFCMLTESSLASKLVCVCSRGANKVECVQLCIPCGKQQRRYHL